MNQKVVQALMTAVILCVVILAYGCQSTSNQAPASEAGQEPTRLAPSQWEYAQLQHRFSYSTSKPPARRPEHEWSWSIPGRSQHQRDTVHELCRALSGSNKGGSSLLDLLGLIGSMGWELIDYSQESHVLNEATRDFLQIRPQFDSSQTETWLFKRPKNR